MTAPLLLTYIVVALFTQLVAGFAVYAWRRRRDAASKPSAPADDRVGLQASSGPGWREFRVVRRAYEDPSQTQCSFYLEPVDGRPLMPFRPGQYLTFSLRVRDPSPGPADKQRAVTRCYSLSDRPDPNAYRVTIKRIPAPADRPDLPPGLSSTHFHERIHVGDVVKAKPPAGHFYIDSDHDVPAVLVAGGIGITPMMSMLRYCAATQPSRTLHLYYGVRNSGDHAFKDVLEHLAARHANLHLNVVYSRAGADDVAGRDFQHAGYVDVELLRRTLPHGRHQFYVCGPPAMMESLVPALAEWGVPREDIHFEAFGPASVRLPGIEPDDSASILATPLEVRFLRAGRSLVWDGQDANLLDFAERHGVSVDSGCRSGGCGTCETKVASGTVRYANTPDHEVRPGHCLLCVGMPVSALELDT